MRRDGCAALLLRCSKPSDGLDNHKLGSHATPLVQVVSAEMRRQRRVDGGLIDVHVGSLLGWSFLLPDNRLFTVFETASETISRCTIEAESGMRWLTQRASQYSGPREAEDPRRRNYAYNGDGAVLILKICRY